MKRIILLIVCLLCVCGCSLNSNSDSVDTQSEIISKNSEEQEIASDKSQTSLKDDDYSYDLIGDWYFYTNNGFLNNGVTGAVPSYIIFKSGFLFEYEAGYYDQVSDEYGSQKIQGFYSISDNKISMFYDKKYKVYLSDDETLVDKINADFSLVGNEITIEGFGTYLKSGEIPNSPVECANEFSKKLEGCYIFTSNFDGSNEYYCFTEKGFINRVMGYNDTWLEFDYVVTNITNNSIYGRVERCGGDSECSFSANYKINEDKSISLFNNEDYEFGILTKIAKEDFEKVQLNVKYYICNILFIKADTLNVRKAPSINAEKLFALEKGIYNVSYEHDLESTRADGYTWYRIDEDEWIADKNGEWVQILR